MQSTAQKIMQISHIELLYESARPEPRLGRLLGHVGTYENTRRWYEQTKNENISCKFRDKEEGEIYMRRRGKIRGIESSAQRSAHVQHVQTLLEPQAMIQSQLQDQQFVVVTEEEVLEDSDEGDLNEERHSSRDSQVSDFSSDASGDSDDSHSCRDNAGLETDRVQRVMHAFSIEDGNYNGRKRSNYEGKHTEENEDRKLGSDSHEFLLTVKASSSQSIGI